MNFDHAWYLEQKVELTEHLVEILTPYIFEGLTCIYKEAHRLAKENNCEEKTLLIFQKLLQAINDWNQVRINDETNRIKQLSNTAEYFDDLVKAVIKANIILLTNANNASNMIAQTFYNSFTTSTFIHRCYTECGKDAHNYPYLFYHDTEPMDYKRNQIIITQHIQTAIQRAVRKVMPISLILKEYLISSFNFLPEPSKIELVGLNKKIEAAGLQQPTIDPKIEKQVLNILKEENIKSDKQKLHDIISIGKFINNNVEPKKMDELNANKITQNKITRDSDIFQDEKINYVSSINKNNVINIPAILENDDNFNKKFNNRNLTQSDKKIINLNVDNNSKSNDGSTSKNVSGTSLNSRIMLDSSSYYEKNNNNKMNVESSERIDPSKVTLIEDYGSQVGGKKHNKKR